MNHCASQWIVSGWLVGTVLLAGVPARAWDDGSTGGTSVTIVPIGAAALADTADADAPVKPKKKSSAKTAAKSADAVTGAVTGAPAPAPTPATLAGAVAAASAASGNLTSEPAAHDASPSTTPGATVATQGSAISPIAPIHLPSPEPSALSTAPVWPRPEAQRHAAGTAGGSSVLGLGQPVDLSHALVRGAASLGVMLVAGAAALLWARSRRVGHASDDPARDRLTVVSSRALAPRRSLHLVEVDGVRILVGVDAERIVPLALVPTPPRSTESAAQAAPIKAVPRAATRASAQAPSAPASASPRPTPASPAPIIDERNPVTVDVPELLARASRGSVTRAPDPAALLSLTSSLKRHLRNRANGNGGGNGHGGAA